MRRWSLAILVVGLAAAGAGAEPLQESINRYFTELNDSLARVARSSLVKKTNLSSVDAYFVRVLKRNRTIYSLIRTNTKGMAINEVIRGQVPERKVRGIADQRWYQELSKGDSVYYGLTKEEATGRYYLFWCRPIGTATKGKFPGAIAAKIDLWDCFYFLSTSADKPFLIRMEGISLFSHKWTEGADYEGAQLEVPGIRRISIRHLKEIDSAAVAPVAAADSPAPAITAQASPESLVKSLQSEDKPVAPYLDRNSKMFKVLFGLAIIALIGIIFLVVRFISWFRHWMLIRSIDKEQF
jgi:hypothetical protein